MSQPWHKTSNAKQAKSFSGDFWAAHREKIQSGEFWADEIKNLKDRPVDRLKMAIDNLPLPAKSSQLARSNPVSRITAVIAAALVTVIPRLRQCATAGAGHTQYKQPGKQFRSKALHGGFPVAGSQVAGVCKHCNCTLDAKLNGAGLRKIV